MSKNVVDSVLEFCEETGADAAFIPSRRQVELDGGYVNNWNTKDFCSYVRSKGSAYIVRDHSGPGQGKNDDDGYVSLREDCFNMDMIHIDPWKKYTSIEEGLEETAKMIEFCLNVNSDMKFEIGTEQSIRKFEAEELDLFVSGLRERLGPVKFSSVKYLVIQSGTSLEGNAQTGKYDSKRLKEMLAVCAKNGLLSKEHNGDYIPVEIIKEKFDIGLDSINIAPEFGLIETDTYLSHIESQEMLDLFFKICLDSNKWVKWVGEDFDPFEDKKALIRICGHYVLSEESFISNIKDKIPDIDIYIKNNIKKKLNLLYGKA